jgi:hypothetical protein
MILADFDSSIVLALLGIFVLWFTIKRVGRRPAKSSNHPAPSRPASTTAAVDGHHLDAPASVARWEVNMHETARDLMGRLDSKIVVVDQLVRDARQVAERLETVLRQIEQAGGRAERSAPDGDKRPKPHP